MIANGFDDDDAAVVRPGAYSATASSPVMSRRMSMSSSFALGTGEPREWTRDEEAQLDHEWGLSRIGSSAAGYDSEGDMTGVGLRTIPRSDSGRILANEGATEREGELGLGANHDELEGEQEVLETQSIPGLDHKRRQSFSASILDELEGRLQRQGNDLTPEEEADARARAEVILQEHSDGPRIKVIERQKRSRTLSNNTALDFPLLPAMSASLEEFVESSKPPGKARTDSLFARPGSALAFSPRPRTDSNESDAVSRFRTTTHDTEATRASQTDSGPTRPPSAMSMTNSVFTSRFDPNVIRVQREGQMAERPQFSNTAAGRRPDVVLMPAPLAGQRSTLLKKPRKEGPSGDSSQDEAGSEDEDDAEEDQPQRPAGALYGRSLMDVMEERKALLKAQQRAYVPGSDGRRGMMDWRDSPPIAPESLASQGALAKLEGRADEGVPEGEEEVPLALLPAGRTVRNRPNLKQSPQARSGMSIFGPDLLYQRELAAARKMEEEERLANEEIERRAREVEEKRQIREERRRLKKKMGSKALQHRDLVDQQLASGQFKTPADLLRESQSGTMLPCTFLSKPYSLTATSIAVLNPIAASGPVIADQGGARMQHGPTPSISIPLGLATSGSDWFVPTTEEIRDPLDEEDEEEGGFRPRPLGGVSHQAAGNGFHDSDSEDAESIPDIAGHIQDHVVEPRMRQLPLPGAPSTEESGAYEEDEDEVPLGRRYSRQSLALISPAKFERDAAERLPRQHSPETTTSRLQANPSPDQATLAAMVQDDPESEDDVPLGKRYSTMQATEGAEDDDMPLALRRLSLAPPAVVATRYSDRFQPRATIVDLDEEDLDADHVEVLHPDVTAASDGADSDDLPLGHKQGFSGQPFQPHPSMQFPSQSFVPPMPMYGFPSASPLYQPPLPDASMQLALAQMQMHAAAVSGANGGPRDGIESWRRSVM
ncbi:uncharacterized protein JCM15063_003437 [Sporobolomyces koalae]|uniref:uncharacterized protein n=1 Tax=Sporobolomyces koalae TaxID=500713 RepID=UPI0031759244